MLRVAEHWYGSDVGRARQGNEDNYFVQAPLFVVADGMGGAQAGEVASELAVEAFRGGLADGSALDGLVAKIQLANRSIHEKSRSGSEYQGMGTTCTAAYVTQDEVVLAHVGDSRCYLLRDGELTRLTHDHSLVGELMDRGKLTEEQAETHPQRSVITRALGIEDAVKVDRERIAARAGDVFLLCSDGLTSMVREAQLAGLLVEEQALEQAGRALIAAANAAGGRDNITVVLFRIDEVEVRDGGGRTTEVSSVGEEPTTGGATAAAGTMTMAAVRPESRASAPPPPRTAPLPAARRSPEPARRRRFAAPLIVAAILVLFFGTALWVASRSVFFLGLDDRRAVTIYRGLPYELPLGIELWTRDYTSGVTIEQVPSARRETFTDHKLRSNEDAQDLVRQLETGRVR